MNWKSLLGIVGLAMLPVAGHSLRRGSPEQCALDGSRIERAYRVDTAMMRRAPRWTAGESGAVSRMPPSPYHAPPTSIAGKNSGSAADAITWCTRSVVSMPFRCGRSHERTPQPSIPCTHVTDWPVV